jgi:hypothetical protein
MIKKRSFYINDRPNLIIIISVFFLFLAHFSYSEIVPNPIINTIAFLIIAISTIIINFPKKSIFLYISVFIICGSFNFAPSFGGLFVILSGLTYLFFVFSRSRINELHIKDSHIEFLLIAFISLNTIGLIFRSPISIFDKLLGFTSLIGYIGLFNISRCIFFSKKRLKTFLILISLLSLYLFLTALNSGIGFLKINSPLILRTEEYLETNFFISVLGRPSGEYGLIMLLFLLPFIYSSKNITEIGINKSLLYFGAISCMLLCLVAFSKSQTVFLLIGFTVQYIYVQFRGISSSINSKTNVFIFSLIVIISLIMFNPVFNFNYILERFQQQPELIENLGENIFEAPGTSREQSFKMGIERLKSDPWIIGYGWAPGSLNRYAWFEGGGWNIQKYDFHNLYYSMPPVFGWIGTISFLGIIIIIIRRLLMIIPIMKKNKSYLLAPAIGFLFFIVFFLVAEYTTNVLTSSNFFMIIWIFLGLAYSICNTFKTILINKIPKNENSMDLRN